MCTPQGFPAPGPTDAPGSVSSKWLDPKSNLVMSRKIVTTSVRNGYHDSLARMGLGSYFTDRRNTVNEGTRKFPERLSATTVWKPGFKPIKPPGSDHYELPRGLGRVQQKDPVIPRRAEMRHIRQIESKEEVGDLPQGIRTVRTPRGGRASDIPAQEVCLEQVMGHKQMVPNLLAQRNGIPSSGVGGDKAYRHPEYMSGFYKDGELAIGSSFVRGSFPKTLRRNATSWMQFLGDPSRKKGTTWKERRKEEVKQEVMGVVEKLGAWENETLKECDSANLVDLTDSEEEQEA